MCPCASGKKVPNASVNNGRELWSLNTHWRPDESTTEQSVFFLFHSI